MSWFCWHEWRKWQEYELEKFLISDPSIVKSEMRQKRVCKICGKIEDIKVR